MELPTYRAIGELVLCAIGLSGLSGDAQSYLAIELSGVVCHQGIGENFRSGLSGLSGQTSNREPADSFMLLQRLRKWQEGAITLIGNFPDRVARTINPDWEFFQIGTETRAPETQTA